jgi:hypothetical protein
MLIRNIEGIEKYNIESKYLLEKSKVTAMLRLRNEEEMLKIVVNSIYQDFDQILLCVQGSSDNTLKISRELESNFENVRVAFYPFQSLPNGEGYQYQYDNSVYSRTYFYNWCLGHVATEYVYKWDGDMLPLPKFKKTIENMVSHNRYFYDYGIDIAADGFFTTSRVFTGMEIRLFKKKNGIRYVNGKRCERLGVSKNLFGIIGVIDWMLHRTLSSFPVYLHFKWCKPESHRVQAWPKDWKNDKGFSEIMKRSNFSPLEFHFDDSVKESISQAVECFNKQ